MSNSKLKTFYKKHIDKIVILLLFLLFVKGCQKSGVERRMEYSKTQYEKIIDSLNTVNNEYSVDTKDLCDTIHSLRAENTILKEVIKDLKDDKQFYQKTNKNLTDVATALSKRDTLK